MQTYRQAGWSGIENPMFDEGTGELTLGDIIVSIETVKRHAAEYGNTIEQEATYMLIHSTLHLLGYDHADESSEKLMHDKSEAIFSSAEGNER